MVSTAEQEVTSPASSFSLNSLDKKDAFQANEKTFRFLKGRNRRPVQGHKEKRAAICRPSPLVEIRHFNRGTWSRAAGRTITPSLLERDGSTLRLPCSGLRSDQLPYTAGARNMTVLALLDRSGFIAPPPGGLGPRVYSLRSSASRQSRRHVLPSVTGRAAQSDMPIRLFQVAQRQGPGTQLSMADQAPTPA